MHFVGLKLVKRRKLISSSDSWSHGRVSFLWNSQRVKIGEERLFVQEIFGFGFLSA